MEKNLTARWETWVQSLGWEDPLEEGMATHSNILAWRIPMDRGAWWAYDGVAESATTQQLSTAQHSLIFKIEDLHREFCSVFYSNLNGKRVLKGMDPRICIIELLCCTSETNTTLLINYAPV